MTAPLSRQTLELSRRLHEEDWPEPAVHRWPGWLRVLLAVAGALALWSLSAPFIAWALA